MKNIDDIILFFESGILKSVVCMAGSFISFVASQHSEGITSNAASVTGWALAISCIVVLAKTVKHLFEKQEEKDKNAAIALAAKDAKIEKLHEELLIAAKEEE